jgi:hypothetical protein
VEVRALEVGHGLKMLLPYMVLLILNRERIPTSRLLPVAYTTKHSMLSLCFFHRGKQIGLVRVFLVQLGFHQTAILKCTTMA